MDIKQEVLTELDVRIAKLYRYRDERKNDCASRNQNEFTHLDHAISDILGAALTAELQSMRGFVEKL